MAYLGVPAREEPLEDEPVGLSSRPAGPGVPLSRLLQVARLSPAQVALIAAEILGLLESLHTAGRARGGLRAEEVHIGPGGEVWLEDGVRAVHGDEARRTDLEAAVALVGRLAAAARTPGRRAAAGRSDLLAVLERIATGNPLVVEGAGEPAAELRAMLGAGTEQSRAGLAALVAALAGIKPALPPQPVPAPASPQATPGELPRRPRRTSLRFWLWRAVATLAVLAAAVGLEYAFLREEIVQSLRLLHGHDPAATASARPEATGRPPSPVPVLAPGSVGPVVAVDVRPLRRCAPGQSCLVRVLVRARPGPKPLRMSWSFEVVDRCTGAQASRPGGEATLKPGGDHVVALNRLELPNGRSLAVIAVTNAPVRAAGSPVPVPATGGTC